jgi:hypothetical protein
MDLIRPFLHPFVLLVLFIIASIFVSSILVIATLPPHNTTYGLDANTTTIARPPLPPKPVLTLEKPMLGFKISYPSDWNITDNDFVISFKAPQNAALVMLSISNLTPSSSSSKANPTLEQYSSNEINNIKSVESKRVGNFFKLLESTPYLLSGEPGHEIVFLNGTNADTNHNYKTSIIWTIVDSKVYQIRYSAKVSEYSNYIPIVIDIIDSFELL